MKTLKWIVSIGALITIVFLVSLLVDRNNQIDYLKLYNSECEKKLYYCYDNNEMLSKEKDSVYDLLYKVNECLQEQTEIVKKLTHQLKYNNISNTVRDEHPCDDFDVLEPYMTPADSLKSRGF